MSDTFVVQTDPSHGGRWTSLVDPVGREWLWHRPDPDRLDVRPGSAFVDAGGVEECFPTITGNPDHGDVWTRPWMQRNGGYAVRTGPFELGRWIAVGRRVIVDYRLSGPPGARFVWAFHALLDPAVGTRIEAAATRCTVWPAGTDAVHTLWPTVADRSDGDILGPDDGSATFCVLDNTTDLTVVAPGNNAARLRFHLTCPQHPVAFGVFRNLGGFPAHSPYRSFGVEPMLGRNARLAGVDPADTALVPPSGELRWRLEISAG